MSQSAEAKVLKTLNGVTFFAKVAVERDEHLSDVEDGTPAIVDRDAGEVNRASAPGLVDAAIRGARECVESLVRRGRIGSFVGLRVVRVVGSVVDTTPDVVACAAWLATFKVLQQGAALPDVVRTGDGWSVADLE